MLPAERKVGLDLFGTPPLHQAWALKATWGDKREVFHRTLQQEGWRSPSFTSNSDSVPLLVCKSANARPGAPAQCCVLCPSSR